MSDTAVALQLGRGSAGAPRLVADDWLRAGLDSVALQGVAGLRIGSLAAGLGVTSGSFYWHFKSRDRFLDAVLRYWLERVVAGSLAQIAEAQPGGKARLSAFVTGARGLHFPDYDRAVWCWALDEERAARSHERAAGRRIARLRDWFAQEGFSRDEAQLRSELLYRGWLAQKVHDGSRVCSAQRGRQYLEILLR